MHRALFLTILLLACSGSEGDEGNETDSDTDTDADADTDTDADTDCESVTVFDGDYVITSAADAPPTSSFRVR